MSAEHEILEQIDQDKITVVIVDSGVNYNAKMFAEDNIKGFSFHDGNIEKNFVDSFGHGTAVYNIVRKVKDIQIINIQLKNIENGIDEESLIKVLTYINENIRCDIINLSLGVSICYEYESLYEICKKITDKGTIMVASFDNYGSMAYPAALECVIGVAEGYQCKKVTDFEYYDDEVVNIGAKSSIQRVAWTKPQYLFIGGNSFACVHVTTYIAELMKKGIRSKTDILENIKEISIGVREEIKASQKVTKKLNIEKAAIFPFNKEMHSLIRFSRLLPFEITKIYDIKYSGFTGSNTNHLLKDDTVLNRNIENIQSIDWEAFDTLIIGHLEQLEQYMDKESMMKDLINQAMEHERRVYCFDDVSCFINDKNREYIDFPCVDKQMLPWHHCGKLYRYSKPVLGVFGTSSKQGKFTLQLTLREKFLEAGYSLGEIGTEPNALLFGMDYVFPMGYNSNVYIKEFDTILYLNHIINKLCIQDKDLILIGSQSGTVTYDEGNLQQYNIPQYNLLLGAQPDAVILCVNPYDEINYINRTIQFIESSVDTRVIGLVVFPMTIKKNWQGMYGSKELITDEDYEVVIQQFAEELQKPTYRLSKSEDMQKLFDDIICFYQEG